MSTSCYKNCFHFSICACHPCAGAVLIFSVSFQSLRMIPEGNPYEHLMLCLSIGIVYQFIIVFISIAMLLCMYAINIIVLS